MTALPAQVRGELQRFFESSGGIADAGEKFNSTDVIHDPDVPRIRFVRAYLTNDVWIVWWEAGGIVRNTNTLALVRRRTTGRRSSHYEPAHGSIFSGNLCAGSKAFLEGARAVSGY